MKNYDSKAEGALFEKRGTTPMSLDEFRKAIKAEENERPERKSFIDHFEELALSVLRDHFEEDVRVKGWHPAIGNNPLTKPNTGTVPEIVLDAFDLVFECAHIRWVQNQIRNRRLFKIIDIIANDLVEQVAQATLLAHQIDLRLEGVELKVFRRKQQKAALDGRKKLDIDEDTLRKAWKQVQYERPDASRMAWREILAIKFRCSESTIERRMKAAKII